MAKKVYTLNMSITYDKSKPGEFVEKGFQYGFPNVVLYVWTKTGKDGKVLKRGREGERKRGRGRESVRRRCPFHSCMRLHTCVLIRLHLPVVVCVHSSFIRYVAILGS